ncbi:hypothetical protein Riv7116_2994 [Rivularia sp. PCC 7116]|uniref:hypothetical protein n=1 Tax=Rivularia sp. PCC 7116 TaxID=373994 RepID=UPI00029EE9EC|nr:hypothetical protein [Rivularia sp. PCC 7116]AFY55475.1 hypothetical protein Riv7116_2994 [Rivularia sp. PCC 7116]
MSKKFKYQQQESLQTLEEALKEYYSSFNGLITEENTNPKVAKLFRLHDVTHVVFGCDTSIKEETLTDTWTIFGSTVTLGEYMEYLKYPETTQVLKEEGILKVFWIFILSFPDFIKVILYTFKMRKKWNFWDYQQYSNHSLKDIREEFNIQVV